jgi:hypothetical protein
MAAIVGCHSTGSASTVETVAGLTGMFSKNSAIIRSRKRLKPTSPPPTSVSRTTAIIRRLSMTGLS